MIPYNYKNPHDISALSLSDIFQINDNIILVKAPEKFNLANQQTHAEVASNFDLRCSLNLRLSTNISQE